MTCGVIWGLRLELQAMEKSKKAKAEINLFMAFSPALLNKLYAA